MTIEEFLHHFPDYDVTPRQLQAARTLEYAQPGQFLKTFGFDNAETILWGTAESMPWECPRSMWSVQ